MKKTTLLLIATLYAPIGARADYPIDEMNPPPRVQRTPTPNSCQPVAELETSLELTIPDSPKPMTLDYSGCREVGRNDYQSGYTERYYVGDDGYVVTLVTDHGDGAYPGPDEVVASDVFLSQGDRWVARFGAIANDRILSGRPLYSGAFALRARTDR